MPGQSGSKKNASKLIVVTTVALVSCVALTGWTISTLAGRHPETPRNPDAPAQSDSVSAQDPMMAQRTKGDPNAPITIYEITDFGCPWCREFYRLTWPSLEREYIETGKARLIFVNLPVPELHPNSPAAHEFAMCAAQQDKFWPVHDLLYQHQASWTMLETTRSYFTILADSAGLDLDSLNTCFDTGSVRWLIQREAESVAQQGQISSTPSFILEQVMLAGYQPIEGWRPILDSLLAVKTGGNRP
jgi:protein-disulfide isomerase